MIKIIDNFLGFGYFRELENLCLLDKIDWKYLNNISGHYTQGFESEGHYGFYHQINDLGGIESKYHSFVAPFLLSVNDVVNGDGNMRSRFDMVTNTNRDLQHGVHVDFDKIETRNVSAVFYLNDSDGDTIIYNERQKYDGEPVPDTLTIKKRISPKSNRLVLFSGNYWHTGESPRQNNRRVILNSNYSLNDNNTNNEFFYEYDT
jgi:hypothetical protein